jgi:sugar/nucleoside kinase (ribokinase family)
VTVIVVIGRVLGRSDGAETVPAGFAAVVASMAATQGSRVELVTRVGDDDVGDAVLIGLARAGVGHVATLRDAGRRTPLRPAEGEAQSPIDDDGDAEADRESDVAPVLDAADAGLALRYLADYRVIVLAHMLDPDLIGEVVSAARWAGAHLVIVTPPDFTSAASLPDSALVVAAEVDAEAIASRLGAYASAIDAGHEPDTAYAVLTGATAES